MNQVAIHMMARRGIFVMLFAAAIALALGVLVFAPQRAQAEEPASYLAEINIEGYGMVSVVLDRNAAPKTVDNFVKLAKEGFYDGLTFHRIEKDFVMQGGDPKGDGSGGSGANVFGEFKENGFNNPISHTRGAISMARGDDPNSASSQFFIVQKDATYLDGKYAAFGHVTSGMDVVDTIMAESNFMNFGTKDKPNWLYIRSKPKISSVAITPSAPSSGWIKSGNRWWYSYDNTMKSITGKAYPSNGWAAIDGNRYYFDNEGWMIEGWMKLNNTWYYLGFDGAMKTGWQYVDGQWYYMDTSGVMKTGWQHVGEQWYFLDSSGAMRTGWLQSSGKWYYLNSSSVNASKYPMGAMLEGYLTYVPESGGYYLLGWDGAMLTGWQKVNDDWFCFNGSGAMLTGWQNIGGTWYYMSNLGVMQSGWQWIGGAWYYLGGKDDGAMKVGWQMVDDEWYYMNGSGAMLTGWQNIGGTWYYMNPSGAMVSNCWIGNYYLQADGSMAINAWVDNDKYYVDSNGAWVPNAQKPASQSVSSSSGVKEPSSQDSSVSTGAKEVSSQTDSSSIESRSLLSQDDSASMAAEAAYWVSNDEVYHSTNECTVLSKSDSVQSGSVDQAKNAGKIHACENCMQ